MLHSRKEKTADQISKILLGYLPEGTPEEWTLAISEVLLSLGVDNVPKTLRVLQEVASFAVLSWVDPQEAMENRGAAALLHAYKSTLPPHESTEIWMDTTNYIYGIPMKDLS